jgi:predicted glycosyltransferase involved in capsule biosynthesis
MTIQSKISFISYIKVDNELREKNIRAIIKFYKSNFKGCEFIGVEESSDLSVRDWSDEWDQYFIIKSADYTRKTYCYNLGARKTDRDILIFLDVDIIVNPIFLLENISRLYKTGELECMVGYNGAAIYLNEKGEADFIKSNNISDLYSKCENLKNTNDANEYGIVGNTRAVGGCLIITKKTFNEINGFNPFFRGWGYEDNEIVSRAHRLGVNVLKSNIPKDYLFHLPHSMSTDNKSRHEFYKNNEAIAQFVETLNREQLKQYIKQW